MGIEIELETLRFQNLVKAVTIGAVIETPTLQFKQNQLKAVNKDIASVVMSHIVFKDKYFSNYKVESDTKVTFRADMLLKISNQLSDKMTKVHIEPEKNEIKIFTDTQEATLPTIESILPETKLMSLMKENENGEIEITEPFMVSEQIPLLKKEINTIGETETIFTLSSGELLVQQRSRDGYSLSKKIKKGITAVDFSVIGATSYLGAIFNSMISDEIELKISKDLPLIFIDKADEYSITTLLAPRVEG